jgi:hypothetical protein
VSQRIDALVPALQPWARWIISAWPYGQLTSTRRTRAEQTQLYAAFLRGESRFPALPPGHSKHELGLAFDYVAPIAILRQMGALWQSVGGGWSESDAIHFEA